LSRKAQDVWDFVDSLLLPTAPTIFTHAEIAADPVGRNTQLGYYTNFVNLLNLSALAVPAGMRGDGLPFGVTFIAPAMAEESLLATAAHFAGGTAAMPARGHVDVAVVGAHLSGQPLNHQLTSRGAFLVETAKTAPEYRFYALPGSAPPKPGLRREPGFAGPGIEVEVWRMPEAEFGGFVALIPPPLGIGTVMLQNGKNVKCFIAEPYGLEGAQEITSYGGWRAYLAGQ
jgi:allophanate hydrolase